MATSEEKTDNRIIRDRRKYPTPLISRYSFYGGQRKMSRRETDRKQHIFVDQYSTSLFIILLLLLILSLFDGFFTFILIKHNIVFEANPIMAFFLGYDHVSFFAVKFLITGVSVLIFCLCKNNYVTKIFLGVAVIIYLSIVLYELNIIHNRYPLF